MAACPRLTELTIICPHAYDLQRSEMGTLLDPVGGASSAASELVNACKALPDFDTLQIVDFPLVLPCTLWAGGRLMYGGSPIEGPWEDQLKQILGMKAVEESVMSCLKPKKGCQEEGRKRTTFRMIKLSSESHSSPSYLGSVKVEEHEV